MIRQCKVFAPRFRRYPLVQPLLRSLRSRGGRRFLRMRHADDQPSFLGLIMRLPHAAPAAIFREG
jgi:hypothetical protein